MGQKEVVDGGCYLISSTAWPMNLKLSQAVGHLPKSPRSPLLHHLEGSARATTANWRYRFLLGAMAAMGKQSSTLRFIYKNCL